MGVKDMGKKATVPRRLRCFVAMAFGREDTDQWYKSTLEPLVRRHRLTPRRVDRITHNDDVDDRILEELAKADLVVADLTYARQSVYFEAGHAVGRRVPVIYTCRSDHLQPGAVDPHRVHFDLQMKNIIDWKGPRDPTFIRRMDKQVSYVTAPLRKDLAEKTRRGQAEKAFAAMSQTEQLAAVAAQVEGSAIRHGFKVETFLDSGSGIAYDTYFFPGTSLVVGEWFRAGHRHGFQCMVRQSFKQSDLVLANSLVRRPRFNLQLPRSSDRLSDVADLLLLVSLSPLQLARVRGMLDRFNAIDTPQKHLRRGVKHSFPHLRAPGFEKVIQLTGLTGIVGRSHERVHLREVEGDVLPGKEEGRVTYDPPDRYIRTATVPRRIDVCVIDSVASLDELTERVESALLRFDRS